MSLSHEEERRLVKAARAGDQTALPRLLAAHREPLYALAHRFAWPRAVTTDDLAQEGALRLSDVICKQNALNTFNPDAETRLWSFAYKPVRWRMIAFTREVTGISKRVLARRNKVVNTLKKLQKELNAEPSIEQLAAKTNLAPEVVQQVLEINTREVSLKEAAGLQAEPFEPIAQFSLKAFYHVFLMVLKPATGAQKYTVLLILKELRDITLTIATDYVRDPQAEIGVGTPEELPRWTQWHAAYDAPDALPTMWEGVAALFKKGTPQLQYPAPQAGPEDRAAAHKKSYTVLRKFYTRANKKVVQIGMATIREQIELFRQRDGSTDS